MGKNHLKLAEILTGLKGEIPANPVTDPVCDGYYHDCDQQMFSDDFPGRLTLGFGDDIAQNSQNRQSPDKAYNDGRGKTKNEYGHYKGHGEQEFGQKRGDSGSPNLFDGVNVLRFL